MVARVATGTCGVDGQGEQPEQLAAVRPDHGRADQHAAVGVLDNLDESVVAGAVDPAARRRRPSARCRCATRRPASRACCSVIPTRPTSGSVNVAHASPW